MLIFKKIMLWDLVGNRVVPGAGSELSSVVCPGAGCSWPHLIASTVRLGGLREARPVQSAGEPGLSAGIVRDTQNRRSCFISRGGSFGDHSKVWQESRADSNKVIESIDNFHLDTVWSRPFSCAKQLGRNLLCSWKTTCRIQFVSAAILVGVDYVSSIVHVCITREADVRFPLGNSD
jgi:hypothetical protein